MLQLLKDNRIYGKPRYYLGDPDEALMQIPDEIRKCVVFIGRSTDTGMNLYGTGFFVVEEGKYETNFTYLVTAKHILAKICETNPNELIYLRVNHKEGTKYSLPTNFSQWIPHPDLTIDIAVLPCMKLGLGDVDYLSYPLVRISTDEVINKEHIDIGDEVFLPGLFLKHKGEAKNIPIVRIGNIAAMPDEQVETKYGMMDAYLIECRSIGGLSGSPVFVNLGSTRVIDGGLAGYVPPKEGVFDYPFYLLGVMHGHWEKSESSVDTFIDSKGEEQSVNMGIAIVIPISKIIEAIDQPKVKQMKDELVQRRREKILPVADSVNEEITQEQFYKDLSKVAKRVKKPKSDLE